MTPGAALTDGAPIAPPAVLGEATTYNELIWVLNARREHVGISLKELNEIADLTGGHAEKIFGAAQVKKLGPFSMWVILAALGLKIVVQEDPKQAAKMQTKYVPSEKNQARPGNLASPAGRVMLSRVFGQFSRSGGKARMAKMSKTELRDHQRRAAMAGVRKRRKLAKQAERRRRWRGNRAKANGASAHPSSR